MSIFPTLQQIEYEAWQDLPIFGLYLLSAPIEHIEKQCPARAPKPFKYFRLHCSFPVAKKWMNCLIWKTFISFFPWHSGWSPCFPHNQPLQNYMPVHQQCQWNKAWLSGDRFASICLQIVPRESLELAVLQNVSVEENILECNAKNGSCTCKSSYQGNRCQKGTIW